MASMAGGPLDLEQLIRLTKSSALLNRHLQAICVNEGLQKIGVKADLQNRIIARIQQYSKEKNYDALRRLKEMMQTINTQPTGTYAMASGPSSAAQSPAPMPPNPYSNTPMVGNYNVGGNAFGFRPYGNPRIDFKSSPYYEIKEQLGNPIPCEIMQNHRHTVKLSLKAQEYSTLTRLSSDMRVMVFCAIDGPGKQDIAFPHQSEIKINGGEIKANLRGLKSKPGSTRPVDITKALRLNPVHYANLLEMTYALTAKKYYLVVYIVKAIPVTDLVKQLETGKRITEKSIVDDMLNKAKDADIVTTASVLSLKCPLSTLRIDLPCRSIACKHNQCFDATSYLQLQEQGPTWLCPICNRSAPFDSLAVDEYVKNILKATSRSVDQVTIQPNGKWELHAKKEPLNPSRSNGAGSDSDDDLIEVTKSGDSIRMSAPRSFKTPVSMGSRQSREPSISSGPPRDMAGNSTGTKRAISAVIDLTSSGDEDEIPLPRAPKRPMNIGTLNTPSASPAYRPAPVNGLPPRPL